MPDENPLAAAAAVTVRAACQRVGLDGRDAELLRSHSNVVFRLTHEPVVVRVGPSLATLPRADNAVRVTRWLIGLGFPTVEPLPVTQPLVIGEHVVTLWRYLPQRARAVPHVAELGRLLRELHSLPPPPVALPVNQPLGRLRQAMTDAASTSALRPDQTAFLSARMDELTAAYAELDFVLEPGLVHGDAHKGNLLLDGERVVLCDWDSVSVGPREWDLVPTHQGQRFGLSAADQAAFTAAYGYDPTGWPGFDVLRDLRDLFSLGAYIRTAEVNPAARRELEHRLDSLRDGDRTRRWYPL